MAKFAEDTKLFRMVKSRVDFEKLQDNLSKLGEWTRKGQMKFSVGKYMVMHTGTKIPIF